MALFHRADLSLRPMNVFILTDRRSPWPAWALRTRWICKLLLPACLLLFFSPFCFAQDFPRWELSGGASYYLVGRQPGQTITTTAHGAQAGLARSFNRYFRIAGEFDVGFANRIIDLAVPPPGWIHYNDKLLLGLVGPEFVYRKPNRKFSVFGHYLTGVAYARDNQIPRTGSPTGLAEVPAVTGSSWLNALGSGLDMKIPHQVSWRVLEVDWMRTDFPNNPHSNWRFATGVVLRLGQGE